MHMTPQRLSARDDDGKRGSNWGPIQIAAPAIVGGVLLLAFAIYVIWKRRRSRNNAYDYHQVGLAAKIERAFVRWRTPRIVRSTASTTLDDSMHTPPYRLNSTDSQTPLTQTDYHWDYPVVPRLTDSPPPMQRRLAVRWWRFFGSRPQEIKSEEPGSRWRVDASDGSSSGHGHSNHGHEEYRARYVGYLETMQEDPEDGGVGATPMRPAREMSLLPDCSGSFVTRIPAPVVALPRSHEPGTQISSADRGLPPSYEVSYAHTLSHHSSVETVRPAPPDSHVVLAPPLRTAGYSSPRMLHGRDLPSDSLLPAQSPMTVATSVY